MIGQLGGQALLADVVPECTGLVPFAFRFVRFDRGRLLLGWLERQAYRKRAPLVQARTDRLDFSAMPSRWRSVTVKAPPSSMLSKAFTTRLSTTGLISWALTQALICAGGSKTIFLPLQLGKC